MHKVPTNCLPYTSKCLAPLTLSLQVNETDVRSLRARYSKAVDLDNKEIGAKYSAEALAAMLFWSAPTLTRLSLRCSMI